MENGVTLPYWAGGILTPLTPFPTVEGEVRCVAPLSSQERGRGRGSPNTAGVITNSASSVISNNLYDLFGVKRYEQGSAETPWRWKGRRTGEEGQLTSLGSGYLPMTSAYLMQQPTDRNLQECLDDARRKFEQCVKEADINKEVGQWGCEERKQMCISGCYFPPDRPPNDIQRCIAKCLAEHASCMRNVAIDYLRAVQKCYDDWQKRIDQCRKRYPEPAKPVTGSAQ